MIEDNNISSSLALVEKGHKLDPLQTAPAKPAESGVGVTKVFHPGLSGSLHPTLDVVITHNPDFI